MANLKDGTTRRSSSHIAEKFVPTSFWTEDANGNSFLDIDLPGFKHEEVRLELASAGHIKIEGERIVNETKCLYIDQTFPLPENSDTENIVGKFEGEHLHITVPKIAVEENKEDESEKGNGYFSAAKDQSLQEKDVSKNDENQRKHEGKSKETCNVASAPKEKWEDKDNQLDIAIRCLKRNKGFLLSIILSFSIGVWVSKLWI
ncbi:hypothetical protein REPUB_Repub07fG0065200 [Reevesia pubescens]